MTDSNISSHEQHVSSSHEPTFGAQESRPRSPFADCEAPDCMPRDLGMSKTEEDASHTLALDQLVCIADPQIMDNEREDGYEDSRPSSACESSRRTHTARHNVSIIHDTISASNNLEPATKSTEPLRLLALPPHIRQQIWAYALTDPSVPSTVVHIRRREPSPRYYKVTHQRAPRLLYRHEPTSHEPSTTALLLTNRKVYIEALPILYKTKIFHPLDLEGLLPLFLENLSPFARSCVRRIRLSYPDHLGPTIGITDRSKPSFHWAVTCAQVARLRDTLHEVEIYGDDLLHMQKENRRSLLYPLCKIKIPKKFTSAWVPSSPSQPQFVEDLQQARNEQFQNLLTVAEDELKASAKKREEVTKADAAAYAARREAEARAQAQREEEERLRDERQIIEEEKLNALHKQQMREWAVWAEENIKRMATDLQSVQGMEQFERELAMHFRPEVREGEQGDKVELPDYAEEVCAGWDVVSVGSGAGTPRPGSSASGGSGKRSEDLEDEWIHETASTLVDEDNVSRADTRDSESADWEFVGRK